MRVVVTGGAGFIGSNLSFALLAAGNDVMVVDDLSTGSMDNLDPRCTFRHLDILDPGLTAEFEAFGPDAVVHLAAQASVSVSIADPERDRAVNAEGTRLVALAAAASGARRMLSASSAAVYGEPESLPLAETARKGPMSPYGESKLEAESLLAAALAGTGTDHGSLRFANVYGPRQDAAGEGGVVAIFCDRLRRGEAPVIFGDGKQTRDFIYVGDVVAAIMAGLASTEPLAREGADGASYNVSTGIRSSVEELLMSLRVASGYFGPATYLDARDGDIVHSALDPSKAESVFGFRAGVTLDAGLAMTWRWFSSRS